MRLVYFAAVREALARDEDFFDPTVGVETIAQLLDHLVEQDALHARAFADRSKLRFALDQQMVKIDAKLGAAQELAIFPPVTGG
jgi:molybdopterin synthase sulfur carrier subunit